MTEKKEKYEEFIKRIYGNLEDYKTNVLKIGDGLYKGKPEPKFFPDEYQDKLPAMLYKDIVPKVEEMQQSAYKYKYHPMAKKHIASSQTACVNLFVPILESQYVDKILKSLDACPKDFDHMAKEEQLYNGYCFEFWGSVDDKEKGLLGDHSKRAGTDSDVAIAYYNTKGKLCLWLIEHKLTEREFTTCGGYRSKGNDNKEYCRNSTIADMLEDQNRCYYHEKCKYNYWKIMKEYASEFFSGNTETKGCPFRKGMNQLWRNQLLAMELEKKSMYDTVTFSVVHHPDNTFLQDTIAEYAKLTKGSPKFNSFTSDKLIKAAEIDAGLKDWIKWYKEIYLGEK